MLSLDIQRTIKRAELTPEKNIRTGARQLVSTGLAPAGALLHGSLVTRARAVC